MRAEKKKDNLELLRGLQNKEAEAVREFVGRYAPRISAYLKCFVYSSELCEDLTQEALVKACRKCSQIRNPRRFESWLFTMTRNMAFRELQRKRHSAEIHREQEWFENIHQSAGNDPVKKLSAEECSRLLNNALSRLDDKRREIMALRYYSELSHKEIAEVMHIPVGSIGVTISRSLETMKKYFDSKGMKLEDLI